MTTAELCDAVNAAYGRAHDAVLVAEDAGRLPADIGQRWPNILGSMRRVPGPYHRPAPNGLSDTPTDAELAAWRSDLLIVARRCERACSKERP